MHDSHLPLRKWLIAICLMFESREANPIDQMKRTSGIAPCETAWFLRDRIRPPIGNDPFDGATLFGVVEVDETLVGVKRKNVGSGNTALEKPQCQGARTWWASTSGPHA